MAEIGLNILGFLGKLLSIWFLGKVEPRNLIKGFFSSLFIAIIIEAPALFLLGIIRKLSILAKFTSIGVIMIVTTFVVYWLISWLVLNLAKVQSDRVLMTSLAVAVIAVLQMLLLISLNISLSNMTLLSMFGP